MAITFPDFSEAQTLYISGQNYAIDNGGKSVTLFFPARIETASGISAPMGDSFLSNGSTSFFPTDNYMAGSGSVRHVQETKNVKMLCTVTSQNREARMKIEDGIGINFKKELNYVYSKFYMTEYHNVINAEYAVFNMPESGMDQMKFRLASQPRDRNSIARGYYACCWWEQIP